MLATPGDTAVRSDLLQRVVAARQRSDELFSVVRGDSLYERPIPERHRIIFYVGHLEAFDWNLLHELFGLKSFSPENDRLFAFGIDPVGGGLPSDQPSDWPAVEAVREYVANLRGALDRKLSDETLEPARLTRDGYPLDTLLNVAIEHRLMHLETLAYMLHQLPIDRKVAPRGVSPQSAVSSVAPRMIEIPAGPITLGLSRDGAAFGWDNEYESHTVHVPSFEIDEYMVTNEQFLAFIAAGGYEARDFWSEDDWKWKTDHRVSHPVFWKKVNGAWMYRGMFEEIPLPLNWPVYVSHAEAAAYARWAGKALPSEEQWQRAAYGTREGQAEDPWGREAPNPQFGNYDFHRWDPAPVNEFPAGCSFFGVQGMLGNGWEWTSSVFAPFRGFEPFAFYRGYSADFFDGKHFVMKGGSARTAACMLRPTFRNWFQGHYQYVYAGFRCVNA